MPRAVLPKINTPHGVVFVATRDEVEEVPAWERCFADHRQDHRYYRIVEDTIRQGFEYRYFVIEDHAGQARAVQPFFVLDQDLLEGAGRGVRGLIGGVRKILPRLFHMRSLMVGCAAGEGHLGGEALWVARCLHSAVVQYARMAGTPLIVLKEFNAVYRGAMSEISSNGFRRIPSFPMTRLQIDFPDFESYVQNNLSKNSRKSLRRNLRAAQSAGEIKLEVLNDVSGIIDEVYPLYLQVFERATMKFEKLTPDYLCRLGREMPDRARFFVWRLNGRAVAMAVTMVHGETLYDMYLGMEYPLALELHLYFLTFKDVLTWAIGQGLKTYCSTPLGYDPKLHLGCDLVPLDLYVRHRSGIANFFMKRMLPFLEPTRHDKTLPHFSNYHELWGDDGRR